MAHFLSKESVSSSEHLFAYSQLISSAHYNHMNQVELTYFETKGGASVPLVFQIRGQVFGFLFNHSESMTQKTIKSAKALLERQPKANVFIFSTGERVQTIMDRVTLVPLLSVI